MASGVGIGTFRGKPFLLWHFRQPEVFIQCPSCTTLLMGTPCPRPNDQSAYSVPRAMPYRSEHSPGHKAGVAHKRRELPGINIHIRERPR